ncbi:hypothetical protein AAWM_01565 [Aspergillus awamori]|uniref:Histone deacetylase complex subunit SAP30 Sin3 binding domain-containing protein n=7 Tax=Aspergillus TaxID=5052 RepID=A2QCJ5_ASPNC|nr:hypothetical protein An02g03790 [Aspergillus niger]XP_026624793.1 hypothetical protein BDQ94DRAFT_146638 [Aspergillus welwitschiae]EHA22817.1 hypothetical protein ASPNIDRAFT_174653 [Aspergillus niger ATCC 1015]RDH25242.1 hypothetical protein M747DRAFT_337064 [Aspergillus niger ATCC 13496]RDK41854.1 hypothetical protein M752DRAFT_20815 [Aspergillus phoenicis ATCC 13157]GCB18680.1 hypothetical protein AAWM_01565 [Aspergillus awamori]KAI2815057.1 hypothetical protein CBS115989_7944 [Aspergill|eukprot:XP_001399515.1 hypothetical protein ANI_1_522024 [Aspergillus niger CBS 513.88]
MAPPRQRTTAAQDDSRSEGSSTAREHKTTTGKSRKGAGGAAAVAALNSREAKASAISANVTSAPAGGEQDNLPKIPWSDMPLELLHSYRHAYKLSTPSAFASEYSHLLLSRGIGLRSPTSIAAQRAHLARQDQTTNGSQSSASTSRKALQSNSSAPNGVSTRHKDRPSNKGPDTIDTKGALHHIIGQERVCKNQLAVTVRKHFNSAGLAEQEAIARFLYKVREEGRGRHFRLRFQP